METIRAAIWLRVSSSEQDEQNQLAAVETYCQQHGYDIAVRYVLHDKSAWAGEHEDAQQAALAAIEAGEFTVLVCWAADRLERRGVEHLFRFLRRAREAGGRVESVQEPLLGGADIAAESMTALGAVMARAESARRSERVRATHARIRGNGGLTGRPPWGLNVSGDRYHKTLVPTDLCREIVPQVFERVVAGHSLRAIAAWLESKGVRPSGGGRWHEGSVGKMVRCRTYAGRRLDAGGRTIQRVEAVVSAAVFDAAGRALASRPGRGPEPRGPKPLLARLRCARCPDSPMYKITNHNGRVYYRCWGKGPQRRGCGNMVRLDELERRVGRQMMDYWDDPYIVSDTVPGRDWEAEIADTAQSIRELDPTSPDYGQRHAELMAELAGYQSREVVPPTVRPVEFGTIGERYWSLKQPDERREFLKGFDIRAEKSPDGIRLVIDGRESLA